MEAESSGDEDSETKGRKEDQYYDPAALARRNAKLDLSKIEDKYRKQAEYEEARENARLEGRTLERPEDLDDFYSSEGDMQELAEDDPNNQRANLPGIEDPKLWQVRVKKNFEKVAVMALINKSIDFARQGRPLSILSVTSSESTEGWIYVEAFKEIHIKQACENLHFTLNKYILLPQEQMTEVYENDKAKDNAIKIRQWVRIKQGGVYN